jgi:hypothetical protein
MGSGRIPLMVFIGMLLVVLWVLMYSLVDLRQFFLLSNNSSLEYKKCVGFGCQADGDTTPSSKNSVPVEGGGVSSSRQVETSRQCSSVLNYIYSGANVTYTSDNDNSATATTQHDLHLLLNSSLPSIQDLWQDTIHPNLLPHIIPFAYSKLGKNSTMINFEKMEADYRKVHNEFTVPRLRKSLIRPMEGKELQKILEIIEKRLGDSVNNPPLEIMTFGGSVVQGWLSNIHSWMQPGYEGNIGPRKDMSDFGWPERLQEVLNKVVFRGQDVVRVTNMATGGATSDAVGAVALEYGLFPPNHPGPDIVINAFGNNDMQLQGDDADSIRIMQDFIEAAKKMRCDGLPYIILYDDFLGLGYTKPYDLHYNMRYYRSVSQVSAWYNLMAVSYANAFRHLVYSGIPDPDLPMLVHWGLDVHPGMVYHSTVPWVLIFNLLENMVNACHDYGASINHQPSYQELSMDQLPRLTSDLYLGDLPMKVKENTAAYQQRCLNATSDGFAPCSPLSWVVNRVGGVFKPQELKRKMKQMSMSSFKDWDCEGHQRKGKDRPGWVASAANATFTVTIKDKDHAGLKYVTIISMKSYGTKWAGSRLRLTLWDEGPDGKGPKSQVGLYEIEGFHNSTTSVLFPYKFPLDGDGIQKGNWLKATFDLIGGSTFRIQGILFCPR